jgi:hypothetical protein
VTVTGRVPSLKGYKFMGLYSFKYKDELLDKINELTEYVITNTGDRSVKINVFKEIISNKIAYVKYFFEEIQKKYNSDKKGYKFSDLKDEEFDIIEEVFQDITNLYKHIYRFLTKNINLIHNISIKGNEFKEEVKSLKRKIFEFSFFLEGIYSDKTGLTKIVRKIIRDINKNREETQKVKTSVEEIKKEIIEKTNEEESKVKPEQEQKQEQEHEQEQTPFLLLFKATLPSTEKYDISVDDYDVLYKILHAQFFEYINYYDKDIESVKIKSINKLCVDCSKSKKEIRIVMTIFDDDNGHNLFSLYLENSIESFTFCKCDSEEDILKFNEFKGKKFNFKIDILDNIVQNNN